MSLPDIAVVTVPDEKQTVAACSIAGPSGAVAVLNGDSENLIGTARLRPNDTAAIEEI
jgi:hypothetical protein